MPPPAAAAVIQKQRVAGHEPRESAQRPSARFTAPDPAARRQPGGHALTKEARRPWLWPEAWPGPNRQRQGAGPPGGWPSGCFAGAQPAPTSIRALPTTVLRIVPTGARDCLDRPLSIWHLPFHVCLTREPRLF